MKILPQPDSYARYHERIGNSGVAVAFLSLAAGPIHHIMRDLTDITGFFLDLYDIPEKIDALAEPLTALYHDIIKAGAASDAEVAILVANYDAAITCPPFFDAHIKPVLQDAARCLHDAGKLLLTHTDGENQGLLDYYLESGFDVADSICPAPMTRITLREHREAFRQKIAIWGGIPSCIMLDSSCGNRDFTDFIDRLFDECQPFDRLILSIADTAPPDMNFDRLLHIIEKISQ